MYKLIFFVPAPSLEMVKKELFALGAGKSKTYAACCWETLGTFQFIPLEHSDPAVGKKGELNAIAEYKVEMLCEKTLLKNVLAKLKEVHPYEEPAYEIYKLCTSIDE